MLACGISTPESAFLKGQPCLGLVFAFLLFGCCDNFLVTLNVASEKQRIGSNLKKNWGYFEGPRNSWDF